MARTIEIALSILSKKYTFSEFGTTFSFSILDVIIACIVIGLFFRIFYTLYDR